MTAPCPNCETCGGSGEVGVEAEGWWHGSGIYVTFYPCPDCDGAP